MELPTILAVMLAVCLATALPAQQPGATRPAAPNSRLAVRFGTPNAARASLETWMRLVREGQGEAQAQAKRCLERYVHPSIAPEDGYGAAWYARWSPRIVFVESTGFWWQEDPRVVEKERAAAAAK